MNGVDPRLGQIKDCLYRVAAKAIIVCDNKILTVCDNGDEYWGLPGGGIDYGEEIQSTLVRELQEEICVKPDGIISIEGPVFISTDGSVDKVPRINIYYKVVVKFDDVAQGSDVDGIKWCTAEELEALYMSPSTREHKAQLIAYL